MNEVLSRWVVQQERMVLPADLDADGVVDDSVVENVVGAAWSQYLDRCSVPTELAGRPGNAISMRVGVLPAGALPGRPSSLLVTAGVSEIRPASLTVSFRLRPLGGRREIPVTARGIVVVTDTRTDEPVVLGDDVRDELIALEHAARHLN